MLLSALKYFLFTLFTLLFVILNLSWITGVSGAPMSLISVPLSLWMFRQASEALEWEVLNQ